ncbi:hypothetical protein H5410_006047 [Solanum commersonii]|uniref:Putative plant transposon protein domain-containing protein n=1 Tax=Solanum commersonii TaxID=4109 RepID=A0A9J6A898_SOLCO|nr:hypothetical protein H5410_006047 [Solanum commersonii]
MSTSLVFTSKFFVLSIFAKSSVYVLLVSECCSRSSTLISGSHSTHSSRSEPAQATGSHAKSSTGSGEKDQAASSDEDTSSESIPVPQNDVPTPVAGEQNRWCVEGQWQIYRDAKMVNDKQKMARLITEERKVLTGSLHTIPDIHRLFNLHKCDWMAREPGTYSEEIVREFYASYAATLRGSISKRSKPLAQDPLTSTLVRGCPVDISPATIRWFLYGPTAGHSWSLNTAEFDYRWDIVRSGAFQRNSEQREAVIHWLAKYIVADGERAEWVAAPRLGIRKATLTFVAKFFWLLVRNRVSPTKADNQVTWDRAVIVAALVAGVEIDFARMLLAEIHERAFRTSTTYPFPCLIFQLCRDSGVPIWHCDRLVHPTGALDIGLIRDKANVAQRASGSGDDLSGPDHTDTVPGSSSQAASMGPSSSRYTPQLGTVVVPLARVQKLEAQMATLLHHIQPWMQKSIAESEARVERRMEDMMDRKVQAVNNRLDAFELRVLGDRPPAPIAACRHS